VIRGAKLQKYGLDFFLLFAVIRKNPCHSRSINRTRIRQLADEGDGFTRISITNINSMPVLFCITFPAKGFITVRIAQHDKPFLAAGPVGVLGQSPAADADCMDFIHIFSRCQ
jgi:hypothetical protein